MADEVLTYIEGATSPSIWLWVFENGALLNLSAGYTFNLTVVTDVGATPTFTTSTGFVGAAGSGFKGAPDAVPNLVKTWALSGEIGDLPGGVTYLAQLDVTAPDGHVTKDQFSLRIVPEA